MNNQSNKRPGVGVGIILVKGNKILLGQRHVDPNKADSELHGEGTWTLPGGKLHFQEGIKEAGIREVEEETGIKAKILEMFSISNDKVYDAHFVTIGFFCNDFEGEPQVKEPDEITQWKWFDLDDLPSPIFPPSEKMIKNYLAKKLYQDD